jgi:hypothetical protein
MEEIDLTIYSDMGLADFLSAISKEIRRRGEQRMRQRRHEEKEERRSKKRKESFHDRMQRIPSRPDWDDEVDLPPR